MSRWSLIACCALVACKGSEPTPDAGPQPTLTRAELMDPETCKSCHPDHYREWSGSMHAYAAEDPVFLAMNQRGQRETNGELGDFCVQCHAPVAVREGLTTDGLNLDEVPAYAKGVTCAFCHFVDEVQGTHNAQLSMSNDGVMLGAYADPRPNEAHASAYSPLHDRKRIESSDLCGSCHDIVTPRGVHIEQTFLEWKLSLFAHDVDGERQTCGDCHMKGRTDTATDAPGVALRRVHDHRMVGVDTALTPFPEMEDQARQIQRELNTTAVAALCVKQEGQTVQMRADLENMAAGHAWPSGATHDRRVWVELIAYDAEDQVVFSSGVVEPGQAVTSLDDPNLWRLGTRSYDDDGREVHMFWDIARVESLLLPPPNHNHVNGETVGVDGHLVHDYMYESDQLPTRVTLRVRVRAMGLDVLDDLIATGDLDPAIRSQIRTFDVGATQLEWLERDAVECIPDWHQHRE